VEDETPVFTSVFEIELTGLEAVIDEDLGNGPDLSQMGEAAKLKLERLLDELSTFSAMTSEAFKDILLESGSSRRGAPVKTHIDEKKTQEMAPNLMQWLKQSGDSGSGAAVMDTTERP